MEPEDPSIQPANFMRPFAFGATAYLFGLNVLQLVTRGGFQSPDQWGDVYAAILLAYSGAPEIKRILTDEPGHAPSDHWEEKIRKGGPLITMWFVLLAAAGLWRMYDPSVPMPQELKSIALKVLGIFFGTYAFRQFRRRVQAKRDLRRAGPDESWSPGEEPGVNAPMESQEKARIVAFLKEKGPAMPKTMAEALKLPRRTVGRLLDALKDEGRVVRQGRNAFDRAAVYALAGD